MWPRRGSHISARDLHSFPVAVAPAPAYGSHVVGQDGCRRPSQEEEEAAAAAAGAAPLF